MCWQILVIHYLLCKLLFTSLPFLIIISTHQQGPEMKEMTANQHLSISNFYLDYPEDIDYETCIAYSYDLDKTHLFKKHPYYQEQTGYLIALYIERLYDLLTDGKGHE